MLRARCVSEGVRAILPGVVMGVYTPDETEEFTPVAAAYHQNTAPRQLAPQNVTPTGEQSDMRARMQTARDAFRAMVEGSGLGDLTGPERGTWANRILGRADECKDRKSVV